MDNWLRQHRFALIDALARLRKAPGSFLFNVLVVAIALMLPFAGLTVLENIRPAAAELAVEAEISVFLRMDTPREKAAALAPAIRRVLQDGGSGGKLDFVAREKALEALKQKTGQSDALATLGANPLPDAYVIKLANFDNAADAARIDAIAGQLKSLPGVDQVQVDSAWIKRLAAILHVLRLALLLLGATLGIVVVAVVFNTIRLQVMTQREEIEVSRLVGATDSFIYRPFYYTGALLGLAAGAVSLAMVALALQPLNQAIGEFARLYASGFRMAPLGILASVLLLAISGLLGLAGSLISVQRHLRRAA